MLIDTNITVVGKERGKRVVLVIIVTAAKPVCIAKNDGKRREKYQFRKFCRTCAAHYCLYSSHRVPHDVLQE